MDEYISDSMVDDIMDQLSVYDPYIHKRNYDSVYVHFGNLPNGMTHKLRISNHEERARYGYKWQLRLDGIPDDRKPFSKYFDDPKTLVKAFITYYAKVGDNKEHGSNLNVWP